MSLLMVRRFFFCDVSYKSIATRRASKISLERSWRRAAFKFSSITLSEKQVTTNAYMPTTNLVVFAVASSMFVEWYKRKKLTRLFCTHPF